MGQLQNAAVSLESAKDAGMLRTALRSAHKARLRTRLIADAIKQLGVWEPEEREEQVRRVFIRAIESHSIELLEDALETFEDVKGIDEHHVRQVEDLLGR